MLRLLFLLLTLLSACESSPVPPLAGDPPHRPNLILVSVDTLRPDHLGAYGYKRPTSPRIDQFASEGLVFEQAISTSPWTLPSHGAILTGTYPATNGLRALDTTLSSDVPTLAEVLKANGYATGAIVNSTYLAPRYGLHRGFDHFHRETENYSQVRPSLVAPLAMQWLSKRGPEPFFLFIHIYDVHSDYRSLKRFERPFRRPYRGDFDGGTAQLIGVQDDGDPISEADVRHLVDLYDGGVRQMDFVLGQLFDFVAGQSLADGTVMIVTSDHGEEFLERGNVLHGSSLHEELLRVPLIVRGPGIAANTRAQLPASIVDIAPTALSLLGISPPATFDGIDLSASWETGETTRPIFAEADHRTDDSDKLRAVRAGRYKLHHDAANDSVQLYDLQADPHERINLATQKPIISARLQSLLDEKLTRRSSNSPRGELSDEDVERLRSLGYVVP